MFATTRLIRFTSLLVFSASALVADIMVGSKRDEVLAELGKPTSAARRGTREILLYPKGVRIELEGTEVTDIKGYTPTGANPPAQTPAPPPATSATQAPSKKSLATTATPSSTASATPATTPATIEKPHATATASADISAEEPEEERMPEHGLGFEIGVAAVMLTAQFLLTFTALKIAFHYHQMDALWSGILAITGIDVVLQTLFAIALYFQSGEVRLGIAGTGLPGLAMIWTIRHFCLDQRWKRALGTTSAVKTAAVLLNFALLALLAHFG